MRALFVPADDTQPVEAIDVDNPYDLSDLLQDDPESASYDRDALMYVGSASRLNGQPMNRRATTWIKNYSDASKQGRGGRDDPSYGLFGDVIVVGDRRGELAPVPERFERMYFTKNTPAVSVVELSARISQE